MQTVATLSKKLDMSAEEALEKSNYMLWDVSDIYAEIPDELCDLLIDVDENPGAAESYREKRMAERERAKKAAEKAAAKRKAAPKKAAPSASKSKKKGSADEGPEVVEASAAPFAEIISAEEAAKAEQKESVELVREDEVAPPQPVEKKAKRKKKEVEPPSIIIGRAIEHEQASAEVVRADGTHVRPEEAELRDREVSLQFEEEDIGVLAEADRRQEEEERKKLKAPKSVGTRPDPDVVADVIRREQLRKQREQTGVDDGGRAKRAKTGKGPSAASRKTGKTARKRQRKAEKMRTQESMRREAMAAVKEYQGSGGFDGPKKKRKRKRDSDGESGMEIMEQLLIEVEDAMTVEELADAMEVEVTDVILELMGMNIMATKNQSLSIELIRQLAEPKGYIVEAVIPGEQELLLEEPDAPEDLAPRAPVVTVMGHVDHGKTSLLDQVRRASVAAGEAGGITQHIAAYEVQLPQGRVVFLDTPGHAAFTAMRARGAQVTDVVVLVVAADDGVMPQTIEAIDHAKAAEVPIVVAINKIDKPGANPDRIRQELTRFELLDEQWGGKTIIKEISALTGQGVDDLMELLVLETELLELRANPNKPARGAIVEAEITRGQGPVAWVLVQSGTLRVGDPFLAGESYGRVRSMQNYSGQTIMEAGPSTAVVVTGFNSPPQAGDAFLTVKDERAAREIAASRAHRSRTKQGAVVRHVTLEDFHSQLLAGEKHELNIVLKADVQGSVDVLTSSIPKLGNEEVRARIVHAGVGEINESDVLLASASDAVVIGFHVSAPTKIERLAQVEGVDIRSYKIIYEISEDIRKALEGLLAPEKKEVVVGHAEIRAVFKSSAAGRIAGCYVRDGEIRRDTAIRLMRNGGAVWTGKIGSLRRMKDDVSAVQTGYECGINLDGYDNVVEGDIIEAFRVESVAKTLA